MNTLIEALGVIASGHTLGQKINYIRYLFSKRSKKLDYDPVTISIVGTTRCTLSCDMCPTHSGIVPDEYPHKQKNVKDMDFAMFKEVIDKFKNALTVHIIGSGEPLLNGDFFKMVDYAASKGMAVKTFSNGTTIKENIENILNSKLDGITISLNGHDSKEFNRMTGMKESVYYEIYDAARRLVEEKKRRASRVKIKLSFIVDRQNYNKIPDMVHTSISLGADHAFFCNFLPAPYGDLNSDNRVLLADRRTINEINFIFSKYPHSIRRRLTPPVLVDMKSDKNQCKTHFSQIRFDGDGNVSSCSMMLLNMTGNGSFRDEEVWNNDFFTKMRASFLSQDDSALPVPCLACSDNKGVKIR
jgi:MoaA/NifB/PqqE/SkfB family radical SAM enzyme